MAAAQSADVGSIVKVKGLGQLQCRPGIKQDASDRVLANAVQLWRNGTRIDAATGKRVGVRLNDSLLVNGLADVRFRIDRQPTWEGFLYLTPKVIACATIARDTVHERSYRDLGKYRLVDTTRSGTSVLLLDLIEGSAIIQWHGSGTFGVQILDSFIPLHGTEVAVGVNADGLGWIYVREGSVELTERTMNAGAFYLIAANRPPLPVEIDRASLERDLRFYSQEIFSFSWSRQLWLYAAIGWASVALFNTYGGDSDITPPRVRVRIPW